MTSLLSRFRGFVPCGLFLGALSAASTAEAAYDCSSNNPVDWPPPSRPYFMLAVDTSGSMSSCTNPATTWPGNSCPSTAVKNSCGLEPTRLNDAKCAMTKTVSAFAGEVNFGFATYAPRLTGCANGTTPDSCTAASGNCPNSPGSTTYSEIYTGRGCTLTLPTNGDTCGNAPDCGGPTASIYNGATINGASTPPILGGGTVTMPGGGWPNGGSILVDMLKDPTWAPATQPASNTAALLSYFDGRTDNSHELFAGGFTPLEGILRSVHQYYVGGWSSAWSNNNYCATGGAAIDHPSPIDPANDRVCRSLNVILVTDGDESCGGTPADAATAMAKVGVVIQGVRVPINTYVIGFAGATKTCPVGSTQCLDAIAAAGGTTTSYVASSEVQLSQALAGIIGGSIRPETCDNTDNNCNGCVDEGSKKYCDRNRTGSATPTAGQCCTAARATCLANFKASITAANPQGNKFWLPCWDPVASPANPETKWLCTDPGENCDGKDNNCDVQIDSTKPDFSTNKVDEQQLTCGTPPHCPVAETCDGTDQNCDGVVDNSTGSGVPGSICPNQCVKSPELCNGCDDDCDGIADNGIPDVPCGFSPPATCAGFAKCTPVAVAAPGACIPGVTPPGTNRYGKCGATGTTETCNGIDDNCDGVVDNSPTGDGAACTPNPGDPTTGQCKAGHKVCENGAFVCVGYIGPSPEICDGIDNDCDGLIDGQDPDMPPLGAACGTDGGGKNPCTKGKTACVGGAIVCSGGTKPVPEVCNGVDDDCNGVTDDGLTDAPANLGCWNNPVSGTCTTQCKAVGLTWCPPPQATCTDVGTLKGACKAGTLVCEAKWVCRNDQGPAAEICNGADDDCNGTVDDGTFGPPVGDVCGQDVPNSPCTAGHVVCVNGATACTGQLKGTPEVCNGKDDDCDGVVDNGVKGGQPCYDDTFDKTAYPGPRISGQCKPGLTKCDPTVTGTQCVGARGPSPEVCDGLDNDCDGQIDESGTPPDGISGTADPGDATHVIGQQCNANTGECKAGVWTCDHGKVICVGATSVRPEVCDCLDNNCNGAVDEDNGSTPICPTGKTCVRGSNGTCQCAAPCKGKEFPCTGGLVCEGNLVASNGNVPLDKSYCLQPDACGDCTKKTVSLSDGTILCAPTGIDPKTGHSYPRCECKGTDCHEPCFGVSNCSAGEGCAPRQGSCEPLSNCNFFGCPQGQACSPNRVCIDNPCVKDPCPADQACKPTSDFSSRNCVGSCAGVTCATTETCVSGKCEPTGCPTACTGTDVCHPATGDSGVGACGPGLCTPTTCLLGEYCDPSTGRCEVDPCEGVVCPSGQACEFGECVIPPKPVTTPDGGHGTTDGATGGGGATGAGGKGSGAKGSSNEKAVFGLATGGGGCACSVPASKNETPMRGLLVALGAAMALRARRRPRAAVRGGVR